MIVEYRNTAYDIDTNHRQSWAVKTGAYRLCQYWYFLVDITPSGYILSNDSVIV